MTGEDYFSAHGSYSFNASETNYRKYTNYYCINKHRKYFTDSYVKSLC